VFRRPPPEVCCESKRGQPDARRETGRTVALVVDHALSICFRPCPANRIPPRTVQCARSHRKRGPASTLARTERPRVGPDGVGRECGTQRVCGGVRYRRKAMDDQHVGPIPRERDDGHAWRPSAYAATGRSRVTSTSVPWSITSRASASRTRCTTTVSRRQQALLRPAGGRAAQARAETVAISFSSAGRPAGASPGPAESTGPAIVIAIVPAGFAALGTLRRVAWLRAPA